MIVVLMALIATIIYPSFQLLLRKWLGSNFTVTFENPYTKELLFLKLE